MAEGAKKTKTLAEKGAPKIKKLLYMDSSFADSLEVTAALEGVSQSEILRRALAAYFASYDLSKIKNFEEKAKDLVREQREEVYEEMFG